MQTTFDCGNYEVTIRLDEDGLNKGIVGLVLDGITQVLQRKPATDWEKLMAGDSWPTGKRGGKIRPEKFDRTSIPFSDAGADAMYSQFYHAIAALGIERDFSIAVSQRLPGEAGKSRKMAEKFLADLEDRDMSTLEALLAMYGLDPEASREEKLEVIHQRVFAK